MLDYCIIYHCPITLLVATVRLVKLYHCCQDKCSAIISLISSMDILMLMFEPFLEKIEESLFSEMSGKGGTLKLENR